MAAIGRSEHDDGGFRGWLRECLDDDGRDVAALDDLLGRIRYFGLDLNDTAAVTAALAPYADRPSLSYLATPPDLFVPACRGLKAAGVLEGASRLVLEKPIGRDLASAQEINAALADALDESRIFRIDHYLGKAPVQNLLALRLGNTLMEAVWDHSWIESVDILVAETDGVDGREDYYAGYGALRDMVQNHMLQLLALVAMEPPSALDADSIRDEKRKVLRALRPMTADDIARDSVRGRYGEGVVGGIAMLRGLAGPLAGLKFCPTGGIGESEAAAFLAQPNVLCIGGSWIVPKAWLDAGDYGKVRDASARAAALLARVRAG